MKKLFLLFIFSSVFLGGCHHTKELDSVLLEAKELLADRPDSTLTVLENLYTDKRFDDFNQAYYYILLTEARSKNEISLLESDSLVDIASGYFKKNNYPGLLAEAYLWKGRIWRELKEPEQAAQTYLKGIAIVENSNNDLDVLSKLYDELGDTYLYEFLYEDALEIFRKEYELDKKSGESRALVFSLRNIGVIYQLMNKADSAFYYYEAALKQAGQSKDSIYLSDIINNDISLLYKKNKEYNKALFQLKKIVNPTENMELNKAALFIYLNQPDSAAYLLNSTVRSANIYIRSASNNYFSRIESQKENYKAAYDYFQIYKAQYDSINGQKKASELKAVNHLYNIEKESAKLRNQYIIRNLVLFFSVVAVLTILFFAAIFRKKKRELLEAEKEKKMMKLENELFFKAKENDDLSAKIAELAKEIATLKESKSHDSEKLEKTIKRKEEEIYLLSVEIENRRFKAKPIYEQLKKIEKDRNGKLNADNLKKLNDEINSSFDEYITRISGEYTSINDQDILILCLTKLGFSSFAVGRFLNLSGSAIRQRLSRLRQKISY